MDKVMQAARESVGLFAAKNQERIDGLTKEFEQMKGKVEEGKDELTKVLEEATAAKEAAKLMPLSIESIEVLSKADFGFFQASIGKFLLESTSRALPIVT